jgi:hypothetical protein
VDLGDVPARHEVPGNRQAWGRFEGLQAFGHRVPRRDCVRFPEEARRPSVLSASLASYRAHDLVIGATIRSSLDGYNPHREVDLAMDHCRFRTSNGGAEFCQDPAYLEGFCRFHFDALKRGEINEWGVLNERLADQVRRREINFHGIPSKPVYVNSE